jgi:hypothetical protein
MQAARHAGRVSVVALQLGKRARVSVLDYYKVADQVGIEIDVQESGRACDGYIVSGQHHGCRHARRNDESIERRHRVSVRHHARGADEVSQRGGARHRIPQTVLNVTRLGIGWSMVQLFERRIQRILAS